MKPPATEVEEDSPWGKDYLAFTLADYECATDHGRVIETRNYDRQALLPLTASLEYVRGGAVVDGTHVPVIDLGARLGIAPSCESPQAAIFFAMVHAKVLGFVVSQGFDRTILRSWQISAALPAQLPFAGQYLEGVGKSGFRSSLLIDLEALLPQQEVEQLVARLR